MSADEPLLHLTTSSTWRAALSVGSLAPTTLVIDGFIHLSRPDQLAPVANRLFAGRDDLLVVVIDPNRLTDDVRWEPGVPPDSTPMRFPHLYGPLPTAAVTSVLPYRPGPDSSFDPLAGLPLPSDLAARALAFDGSLGQRRAAAVIPVVGGVTTLDPRVADSYEHNTLWVTDDVDAATLRSEADRVMASYPHRQVILDRPPPVGLDWGVDEERVLVLDAAAEPADPQDIGVVAVTPEVMAGLWRPSWFRDHDGITDETVDQLILRESLNDAYTRIVDLAVLGDDGVPMAGTQLRFDGATAAIEAVMTAPLARGRGYARALVTSAIQRARQAGCDCIFLFAVVGDWPRDWYHRLGFVDVGGRWVATKEPVAT